MVLIMSENLRRALAREKGIDDSPINLDEIKDSDELIAKLMNKNSLSANEKRDKMMIQRYLEFRSLGINSMHYHCPQLNANMDIRKAIQYSDEAGVMVSGHERQYASEELASRGKFDYRITMRGSSEMVTDEAIAFANTLVSEANKRNLNIYMKDPWTHDAVILYVDKEELLNTVRLLEDLKDASKYGDKVSMATKHFGPTITFGAVISDNSYYGISMAHSELRYGRGPSKLVGSYGGGFGSTFGSYMEDECLDKAYNQLLKKYNGDVDKITASEMYPLVVKLHREYMLGSDATDDIPLWMNRRNYFDAKNIIKNKDIVPNEEMEKGFYIPTDWDLEDNRSRRHR